MQSAREKMCGIFTLEKYGNISAKRDFIKKASLKKK
jgi:hypothetical protein